MEENKDIRLKQLEHDNERRKKALRGAVEPDPAKKLQEIRKTEITYGAVITGVQQTA